MLPIAGVLASAMCQSVSAASLTRQFVASPLADCGFTATKNPATRTATPSNFATFAHSVGSHLERFFGPTG